MMRRPLKTAIVIFIIASLLVTMTAYALGEQVYISRQLLADNLEYINTISWSSSSGRSESFALNLAGRGDAYPIVLKGDTVFGSTRISTMVSYAETLGKNVLAAVNADFFFVENGVPLGIVVEDGVYKASPEGRNAVVFYPGGGADIIESPRVSITLLNNGGAATANNAGQSVRFEAFNKIRTELGRMVLYSEEFSTVSTRTTTPGWFVRFQILEGLPTVSGEMTLEVTETFFADGAVPIGTGSMLLSASELSNTLSDFEKFAVGDIITLSTATNDARLVNASYATGGGDIIISDGAMTDSSSWFQLSAQRTPRTAFGLRADGSLLTYVIDGRNSEHSIGMTLIELAGEFLNQGVVYAVNFDGGGSTAMSVRLPGDSAARVVSRPSDGSERGCATYLLFVTDAAPDYMARNLSIGNNGIIVLAGSSAELAFTATDSGYKPAAAPSDIQVSSSAGSSVTGSLYTAGGIAGTDRLNLFSPSTGAAGLGEVYIITRPTSITATREGSAAAMHSVSLYPGQRLSFDVTATYYRRAVISQLDAFMYNVTGNIGEMTSPGIFEAGTLMGQSGVISISAGGRSFDINVEISGFVDMQNHWAREYAQFLAEKGITQGISPTRYGPNQLMKRGDFVLMLHRAAGLPAVTGAEPFSDVPENSYYSKAIDWARAMSITTGSGSANMFSPEAPLTRQDAFTLVYRALAAMGIPYTDGDEGDLHPFTDAQRVSGYAAVPTATLVKLGVVEGTGSRLLPGNTLTRAEMAKILTMILWIEG